MEILKTGLKSSADYDVGDNIKKRGTCIVTTSDDKLFSPHLLTNKRYSL